eukprot:TRINITY_DN74052_c0_g1_i1.p1 TRINITY_DN74052_c0_g1~~TRINITY_DN74052_c0_g1_i1.p1  ORF type:complete len:642 (+),score=86.20 TRINITY_DN74052_c0_g1_i1:133-2058(+)
MALAPPSSHYEVLGVSSTASFQEIRKQYLRRALLEHPDKGGSKDRFQVLVIAFEVLSSTRARTAYDRHLRKGSKHSHEGAKDHLAKKGRKSSESDGVTTKFVAKCTPCKPPAQNRATKEDETAQSNATRKDADRENTDPKGANPLEFALRRLEVALRRVDRERRARLLSRMAAAVRQQLLSFMENRKTEGTDGSAASRAVSSVCIVEKDYSSESSLCDDESEESSSDEGSSDVADVLAIHDGYCDEAHVDVCAPSGFHTSSEDTPVCFVSAHNEDFDAALVLLPTCVSEGHRAIGAEGRAQEPSVRGARVKRSSNIRGVMSTSSERSKTPSYCAVVDISHLLVQTRSVSLELAIQYHAVLIQTKQTVLDRGDIQQLPACISASCVDNDIMEEDLELAYCPILSAWAWIGSNIHGRFTIDLSQALVQRQRLLDAKEHGWEKLREAWTEVMTADVLTRRRQRGHRVRPRTLEEAEKVIDAVWERSSKHREKRKAAIDRHLAIKRARRDRFEERRKRGESRRRLAEERKSLREEKRAARIAREAAHVEARELSAARKLRWREQRVASAAAVVERILAGGIRRAAHERKRRELAWRRAAAIKRRTDALGERLRRRAKEQRWRWLNNPARTMEEILRRPSNDSSFS